MPPNLGGWIHSFAVTETQIHKGGYTIYKITSIVFPRSVPQALTCLTIWKRFHDVKRLHRELTRRHKSLYLPGQLPEPTDCSFFKRFDVGVILRRKEYILQLLDFAAQHPALYKCHAFAQFFSDAQGGLSPAHSPLHRLPQDNSLSVGSKPGAIAEICDKLDLCYDPHDSGLTLLDPERDKVVVINQNAIAMEEDEPTKQQQQVEEVSMTEITSPESEKPCKDYMRFLTPMPSIESDDSDYIYEAALEFSHAVQAEANLEYKEAHVRYKRGVEVLLNGSKDDPNEERRFIAKAKISKYLARADDIYDKFLLHNNGDGGASYGKTNFQLSIDITDSGVSPALYLERPWNHLAKYKVVQVLGERVMQVQSITEAQRPTYVMKGVEKPSSNTPTQTVFLPQHVPYMVDLLAFFQSEQKIFLLLKQAEGGRLYDYMQTYTPTAVAGRTNVAALFPELVEAEEQADVSSDSGFEDREAGAVAVATKTHLLAPSASTEFSELVRCSQQLLQSVSNTLKEVKDGNDSRKLLESKVVKSPRKINATTKIPEASLKQWARELAVAVHSLHAKGVILSDLHMANLLLGSKGQLLLTYFYQNEGGLTTDNYVHKAYSPAAIAGHFVAPERPLTFKSDWWSYGVVLYQLLLGLSFQAAHPGNLDLYGCVQYPESVEISENARDLLDNLLQQPPEDRFDYEQIQKHAFFKGTNWEEVQRNGFNNNTTGI